MSIGLSYYLHSGSVAINANHLPRGIVNHTQQYRVLQRDATKATFFTSLANGDADIEDPRLVDCCIIRERLCFIRHLVAFRRQDGELV